MCNLYSMTRGQDALREIAKVWEDCTGNLPAFPGGAEIVMFRFVHVDGQDVIRDFSCEGDIVIIEGCARDARSSGSPTRQTAM